jgi:NitT/TauT family transport system substrate-binding protein
MSALVAQKSIAENRKADIDAMLSDYKASIDFVNSSPDAAALISEKGFIPDMAVAERAIPGCNLVMFEDRQEGAALLKAFYEILFDAAPGSIGGNLPDEDFYY